MKILITGGSGTLGSELNSLFKSTQHIICSPSSKEIDITNFSILENYFENNNFNLVIHCAAYTNVKKSEEEIEKCIDINVIGTCNIVKCCKKYNIKLVHISTEHVFDGTKGNYSTQDYINPIGKYAKSKGASEIVVGMYDNSLIIRTSFYGKTFPYEKALVDQWSSKDYIDIIAPKIFKAALSDVKGIVHCGSDKKTIYEIAKERKKDVIKFYRKDLNFSVLKDTSLVINKEFNDDTR